MERSDACRLLGLPPSFTAAEVEAAFRRHARLTHPDGGGDRSDFEAFAEARRVLLAPSAAAGAAPVVLSRSARPWIRAAARLWVRWHPRGGA